MSDQSSTIRLDKWLKVACLFKSRAAATKACEGGKVKINGERAKASALLHVGDNLTVKMGRRYRNFEVLAIVQKQVSRKEARELYREDVNELDPEELELYQLLKQWDDAGRRKYKGRPTKKERRQLDKLRNPEGHS